VPKTANASNSGVAKATIFITTPSSQTMVSPTAVLQLRYSFIFLIDKIQSRQRKWKFWAAASTFIL
jgi:hypothetical protein